MSPEKEQQLYERYPKIFLQVTQTHPRTCMSFGCECGDGWYGLIDECCRSLELLEKRCGVVVEFGQVKEKFAGLRIYCDIVKGPDDMAENEIFVWRSIVDAITGAAENRSYSTCEMTGEWGVRHRNPYGWMKTLNPKWAAEHGFTEVTG